MKIVHSGDYAERRKKEYPPIEEYVDAQYWLSQGDPSKMTAYLNKCSEVKAKFPKPLK